MDNNHESNPQGDESKDEQFTSTVAGAIGYISKLEDADLQQSALNKYRDKPEVYAAINEQFGGAFENIETPQAQNQPPPEKEEEIKEDDSAKIAKEAAALIRKEQLNERLASDLRSKGVRGEENFSRKLKGAEALLQAGYSYDEAISGVLGARPAPVAPITPIGGNARGSDDDFDSDDYEAFNAEMRQQGLQPVSKEAYLYSKKNG